MTQPEALRLADWLEDQYDPTYNQEQAAAELRRLHAENEIFKKTLAASCDEEREQLYEAGPGGGCSRALSAEFQRDALLEALKKLDNFFETYRPEDHPVSDPHELVRAAIKAVEENK